MAYPTPVVGVLAAGCETGPVPEHDRRDRLTYLDHAATTPLRPAARDAMLPWLGERFGNPSGDHRVARAARQAVDEARDARRRCPSAAAPATSCSRAVGTEADNLAVRGVHAARPGPVLCSAIEHDAVPQPRSLRRRDDGRGRRPRACSTSMRSAPRSRPT